MKNINLSTLTYRQLKELVPEFTGKSMTAKQLEEEEVLFTESIDYAKVTIYKNGCLVYSVPGTEGKTRSTVYTVHRCNKIRFKMGFSKEEYKEAWTIGNCQITYKMIDGQLMKIQTVSETEYLDEIWWMPIVTICEERLGRNQERRESGKVSLSVEEGDEDLDPALVEPDFLETMIKAEDKAENHRRLTEALKTLTEVQRKTILLYYSRPGMTERMVADILGVKQQSVHDNIIAALKKLRKNF